MGLNVYLSISLFLASCKSSNVIVPPLTPDLKLASSCSLERTSSENRKEYFAALSLS